MKQLLRGFAVVLLLAAGFGLWQPATIRAADGFNIISSPLPIKIATRPGETVETELRIKNQGIQSETIKVGLMKFGATGDNGQPDLFDLTPKDTYADWVHFSPSQFIAEPNVWKTVKMTIDVPPEASLGYYLAVTFSRASQAKEKNASSVKGAIATLVLLDTKTGNEKRQLKLVSLSTDHGLYEYLPATFNVKLRNSGNIYLSPSGNIFIERGGKAVDTLDFNTAGGSVLPASNRVFSIPWSDGFPVFKDRLENGKPVPGPSGHPKQNLKWDFTHINKLRIGHYTAKVLVVYDDGTQDVPLEAALSFWVLPWKILLGILALFGVLGFGIFSLVRSLVRRARGGVGKHRRGKK